MLHLKSFIYLSIIVLMFVEPVKPQWIKTNGFTDERVYSMAMNGSTLFVGTERNGIYRSQDNGETWTNVKYVVTDSLIITLKVISNTIYAGTRKGLFRSTDNGDTWTASGFSGALPVMAVKGDTYYVGMYNGGVYYSKDKGSTWTDIGLDTVSSIEDLVVCDSYLFAGSFIDGVFRYEGSGENWVYKELVNRNLMDLAASGNTLFAGADNYGVYRSTDLGSSWTKCVNGLDDDVNCLLAYKGVIFAGTDGGLGVFYSENNGDLWIPANTGLPEASVQTLVTDGETIFAGTWDQGVWRRPLSEIVEISEDEDDNGGCGCGSGTGLAFIPPIGFKIVSRIRKNRRKNRK